VWEIFQYSNKFRISFSVVKMGILYPIGANFRFFVHNGVFSLFQFSFSCVLGSTFFVSQKKDLSSSFFLTHHH